jgi:glycosyltransferase involved in cell wall biosynthesis
MKYSLVIPTYNRENDLKECLDSVVRQTLLPSEIIIIDDGNLNDNFVNELRNKVEAKKVAFIYYCKNHSKERRGLSESKNIGLRISRNDIVFIIDDDVILPPKTAEDIMVLWEQYEKEHCLIGIGGVGLNYRTKTFFEKAYNILFGLVGDCKWDVNDVGFQSWDDYIDTVQKGYYMHGFISSFRKKEILKIGGFDVFSGGRTALEDVAFCLKAKKLGYFCLIQPSARVFHKISRTSREKEFAIGKKESENRRVIFEKYCNNRSFVYKIWFWWANIGWVLRQFLVGHFSKGFGMIIGIFSKIDKS